VNARFRLVQYMPDPFSRTKITIGVLVEVNGRAELVRARTLPDLAYMGGRTAWVAMQKILDLLEAPAVFDVRTGEISPLVGFTEPRGIPEEVKNPVAWVASAILPQ
jgi:hypothetical protein